MKKILLCLSFYSLSLALFAQDLPKQISKKAFSIGTSLEIESRILNENRLLNIYLPASYTTDSTKTYPVIYLLDGSADEDFIHISGIVQFGSFSWINMLPESIVVGIANVDRKRDFTFPSKNKLDQQDFPGSGKSEVFIDFLRKEVQPFINSSFRTTGEKVLIGQSLGGLLATEILFKAPEMFEHYIIVSPSLWWDDESLLKYNPREYSTPKSVYIAVGKEGDVMERTAKELYEKLKQDKQENTRLFFEFLEDKSHGDALHEAVYNALDEIFSPKN